MLTYLLIDLLRYCFDINLTYKLDHKADSGKAGPKADSGKAGFGEADSGKADSGEADSGKEGP